MLTLAMLLILASAAPAAAPSSCSGAEARRFDFWVGEWEVRDRAGAVLGTNRIERILGGCAIQESWTGARGMQGRSVNAWDAVRSVWHQTWVDDRGNVLLIEGGWRDGRMVLEGISRGPGGAEVRNRIAWTPHADGTLRQHWETSTGGGPWTTAFDGTYVRK